MVLPKRPGAKRKGTEGVERRLAKLEAAVGESLSAQSSNLNLLAGSLDGLRDVVFASLRLLLERTGATVEDHLRVLIVLDALKSEDRETAVRRLLDGDLPTPAPKALPEDAVIFGG